MRDRQMREMIKKGEAVDISDCPRDGKLYVLDEIKDGVDYCDALDGQWVQSIGRRKSDGKIVASMNHSVYDSRQYDCLWLR